MIEFEKDITSLTTFGIKTKAAAYAAFTSLEELQQIIAVTPTFARRNLVMGGGSNMLFREDYPGIILHNKIEGITVSRQDDGTVLLTCGAGVNWHKLVMFCVENNYGGIENMALIPGSCGAAPIQNIGAYGVELVDVFHSCNAWHLHDKTIVNFKNKDCHFGYRDSVFKSRYKSQFVITDLTLRLSENPEIKSSYAALQQWLDENNSGEISIKTIAEAVIQIRQSKLPDPAIIGNAGSFFKNPVVESVIMENIRHNFPGLPFYPAANSAVKIPAAWLIEQCGWKGYRNSDAGVHSRQALVLVNYGNASGKEIVALSDEIIYSVQQKFGITLEREVNII